MTKKERIYLLSKEQLELIVKNSQSFRNLQVNLNILRNSRMDKYVKDRIKEFGISTDHFRSYGNNKLTINKLNLPDCIKKSNSLAETIRNLGLSEGGSARRLIKKYINEFNVDISHWNRQSWNKGNKYERIPLELKLKENTYCSSDWLKKKLVEKSILKYECYECGLKEWRGKNLSLHLEHKNGKHTDNRIENLTILCPNCHSQTPTYCGRGKKKNYYIKTK